MTVQDKSKIIFFALLLCIIFSSFGILGSLLAIGIIFSILLAYIIMYKEKITLFIIIIFIINLNYFKVPGPIGNLDVLFSILFIIISFLKMIKLDKITINSITILMSIYILVITVNVIYTPVFFENIMGIFRYVYYLMIIQYVINMNIDESDIITILKVSVVSMCIPIFVSIIQLTTGTGARMLEELGGTFTRAFGLTSHPSILAHYLLIVISMTYIFKIDSRSKGFKGKYYILWFLGSLVLIFTFTRSIIAALLLGMLLYFAYKKDWKLILVPLVFIIILEVPGVGDRFLEVFDINTLLTNSSFYWRLLQWSDVLNLITPESFLFGQGFKSVLYYTKYTTHNEYINLLVENGVIGFILFSIILFTMMRMCFKLLKRLENGIYKSYIVAYMITLFLSIILAFNENNFSVPSSTTYLWLYSAIMLNIYGKYIKKIKLIY